MKSSKLIRETLIFGIGDIGAKLIGFLLIPLYTRFLTTTDYGDYSLILTYQSIFAALVSLQILEGAYRYLLDKDYEEKKVINVSLLMISSLLILSLLITFLFQNPLYILIGVYFSFYVYLQYFKQILRGLNKVHIFSHSAILNILLASSFSVLFIVFYKVDYKGIIYASTIGYLLTVLFIIFKIRGYLEISFKNFDYELCKKILKFSIPLIPSALSWWIMSLSDRLFIDYFVGKEELGVYSVAISLSGVILLFNSMFQKAWQTNAIENFNSDSNEKFYNDVFDFILKGFLVVISLITVFIKPGCLLILGQDFFDAWKYTPILCFGFMFQLFGSFIGTYYWSSKKVKGEFYTSIFAALLNLALNFLFIPSLGILGASIATVLAYFFLWIVRVLLLEKFIKLNVNYIFLLVNIFCILLIHLLNIFENYFSGFLRYFLIIVIEFFIIYLNRKMIFISYKRLEAILVKNKKI